MSFLDIRTFYRDDPDWSKVQAYLDGGPAPVFEYHRFWAQTEIAMALAEMESLGEPGPDPDDTTAPTAPGAPTVSGITGTGATLTWAASTDDVGVTRYTVRDAAGATVATASGTTATLTGLTSSTTYTVEVVARDAAGNVSAASPRVTFTTSGSTTTSCTATYRTANSWPGGFQGEVTVTAGSTALTAWSTVLTVPSGVSVAQVWSGSLSGAAPTYTVRNQPWNGALGAGQSVTYGFVGSGNPAGTTVTCG